MSKKIRFFWRLVSVFAIKHKEIIFASFILGIFSFFVLPKIFNILPKSQETETIGLVGRYTFDDIPNEIQNMISLGLTKVKEDGTAGPGLAREWQVEDEGKTYTFKLTDNVFWHDGKAVTANDINYNFKDADVEILDARTIRYKLKEPYAPFPVIVSKPIFKKGLIGAGNYEVKKITRKGDFIETFFLSSLNKLKPNIKYSFYPTEAAAKTAIKLGEVSRLENIIDPSGFEDWKNIEISEKIRPNSYLAVFFDTSKPNLSEKTFRQALAYAIPKDDNIRVLSPISSYSWAYNSDVKSYEYDLENAKKLYEKVSNTDKKISIRLATSVSLLSEAEIISNAWQELNIKTEIEQINTTSLDFEVLLAIQEIPADPDQYTLWHSSQDTGNITKLKNARIDQLLEEGRKTLDLNKRKNIYFDFQRFLVEEVPAVFLSAPVTYTINRK